MPLLEQLRNDLQERYYLGIDIGYNEHVAVEEQGQGTTFYEGIVLTKKKDTLGNEWDGSFAIMTKHDKNNLFLFITYQILK